MCPIDILMLAGVPAGLMLALWACFYQRRRISQAKVHWNLAYDAGLMALFTFAGEAFAFHFLADRWMAVAVGFALSLMSVFGNWNRLKARQAEEKDDEALEKRVRLSLIWMCCGMELALASTLAWQLWRFFL